MFSYTKILAILLIVQSNQTYYYDWVEMTEGIIYNVSFTPPSPPSGASRTLLDSGDGIWLRNEEY